MEENYVNSNGVKIWTAKQGNGIPILLCNGGPGCCDYLNPVAQMLDDIAQVIRFEQRGCGRSEATRPYDIGTCLADIEAIREFYGINHWIVGGHSWGPDLAVAYAVTYPQRVLGIIGISGGVIHKDQAWSEQYHNLSKTVGETSPDFLFPPNMDVNREMNVSWREYVRHPDLLRRIADLAIPAIFLFGDLDIRPSWPIQQLAELLPRGKFVSITGASHAIWLSHAECLKSHLRDFVISTTGNSIGKP